MADRKVVVKMGLQLTIIVDEGVEIRDVIDGMERIFEDTTGHATVEDSELLPPYDVVDSK